MADVEVYGIRHHGPGSARALDEGLRRQEPDVVCIEMPADFDDALEVLDPTAYVPPIALVAYDPKAIGDALYYPLARFSPEWVAIAWAREHGVPVVAIDLPAPLMIAAGRRASDRSASGKGLRRDPLGELARLAGFSDRERWWEQTFERLNPGDAVFPAVATMIATLREAYPEASDEECLLREAHMAREILRARKGGYERAAVVCGAWHAPVLAEKYLRATASGFASMRRGLRGPKLLATWIPWTYDRLRAASGYAAGVRSPTWYALLFDDPASAPAGYLALTARELRRAGHGASVAQVVDAAELVDALTRLRGLPLAGLEEIREAALGSLAEGSEARLDSVAAAVEGLRTTGRIPPGTGLLPLQRDLEQRLRAARLAKPYREMEAVTRELDLRKPQHLAASRLLCQLLLLDIPFGDRLADSEGARGTFKERWHVHWRPEFALRLLAAHVHGQRISEAAAGALRSRLDGEPDLPALTSAVDLLILAGLFEELQDVAARIRQRAVDTEDLWSVARALPPILRLARYPSLRIEESGYLSQLAAVLLPKLATGLEAATGGLDDDAAHEAFRTLKRLQPHLTALHDAGQRALWTRAVERVAFAHATHPLLAGFALRTLADADALPPEQVHYWLGTGLGRGVTLARSAHLLEGFLYSSATVLLHQPAILASIDEWLQSLSVEEFRSLLPALRRTASAFPVHERRKLSAAISAPPASAAEASPAVSSSGLSPVLEDALRDWLGRPEAGADRAPSAVPTAP